ncbi:MAG: CDP-alcohol phosphatidyltransferase family protein [Ruminococcus sp.]|nr:CDP-alcohol phosphatidyltransferase family protein [Ruminococcus sp.]
MYKMKNIANIITGSRIVFSIAILFIPPFAPMFYVLYAAAGLTDMIDGTVARKTNTVSAFGAKLDTIADFIFVAVCLIKLLPVLVIPVWLWVWIALIALIKAINIISGVVVHKKLIAVHSVMNKVTGALLFCLPLTLSFIDLKYSAIIVCAAATFAAIQEGHYIRTERSR